MNWRGAWAITSVGIRRLLTKKAVILLLFLAWAPVLILGIGFFSIGTVLTQKSITREEQIKSKMVPRIALPVNISVLFSQLLGRVATQDILEKRLEEMLPLFWRASYYHFVQMESWILLFLCLAVGPYLITPDIRAKSLPLYFSRPITAIEYTAGKGGILLILFAQAFILPSIIMYLTSIYFMPSSSYMNLTFILIPDLICIFSILFLFSFFLIAAIGSSCMEFWTFTSFFLFLTLGMELFTVFINAFINTHPMGIDFDSSIKLTSICSLLNDFVVHLSGINPELSRLSQVFRHEWVWDPISEQRSRLGDMPLFGSGNPLWKSVLSGSLYLAAALGLYSWNLRRAAR